jgi:hypothetical protein
MHLKTTKMSFIRFSVIFVIFLKIANLVPYQDPFEESVAAIKAQCPNVTDEHLKACKYYSNFNMFKYRNALLIRIYRFRTVGAHSVARTLPL